MMLNTLIHQLWLMMESMTTLQHKIIQDYDTNEEIIQNISTTPRHMNYIISTKVLHDAKKADANMLDCISSMQENMGKTITEYKNMINTSLATKSDDQNLLQVLVFWNIIPMNLLLGISFDVLF
ncbi:unnamed protein product [Lactuca virosa]|uniref:Uncharacterized protein n=1 Tax=Lactuca virosa TaxID=75947 RepID=A0AAU9MJ39_9ASTR|nr:unnamed protein product [Lactuca virosa]